MTDLQQLIDYYDYEASLADELNDYDGYRRASATAEYLWRLKGLQD